MEARQRDEAKRQRDKDAQAIEAAKKQRDKEFQQREEALQQAIIEENERKQREEARREKEDKDAQQEDRERRLMEARRRDEAKRQRDKDAQAIEAAKKQRDKEFQRQQDEDAQQRREDQRRRDEEARRQQAIIDAELLALNLETTELDPSELMGNRGLVMQKTIDEHQKTIDDHFKKIQSANERQEKMIKDQNLKNVRRVSEQERDRVLRNGGIVKLTLGTSGNEAGEYELTKTGTLVMDTGWEEVQIGNPLTGRMISFNGPTHKKLIKEGKMKKPV